MPAPVFWQDRFFIDDETSNSMTGVAMAALADGGFVAAWRGIDDGMRTQTFNADGTPRGNETRIPGEFWSTSDPQTEISLLKDGGYVVTWRSYQTAIGATVEAAIFNTDGSIRTPTFRVSKSGASYGTYSPEIVSLADGGFMTFYAKADSANECDVLGRIFDSNGNIVRDEFIANGLVTDVQLSPSAVQLNNGKIVVAYSSKATAGVEVRLRLLEPNGTPTSQTEIVVISDGQDSSPSIAALSDGRFVVVWETTVSDGSGQGIYAQIYSANGDAEGSQVRVNTTTANNQSKPKVSALAEGGFAVVFEDLSASTSDVDNYDVRLATFDSAGKRQSDDILVNGTSAGSQNKPYITSLADGRFVIAWTQNDNTTTNSAGNIVGQIFDSRSQGVTVTGTVQNDSYFGTAYADVLRGHAGDDKLYGGGDFDRLFGGAGQDVLDGGDGFDVADYSDSQSALVIDIRNISNNEGEAKGDTYTAIEAWIAGAFNDTITADGHARELWGDRGNDIINAGGGGTYLDGGLGDDTLEGGADGDVLIGGAGFDIVSYAGSNAAVTVSLEETGSARDGHAAGDRFVSDGSPRISIEGIIGSAFNDELTGLVDGASFLDGGGGRDALRGGSFNDTLIGGTGNDTINGGSGTNMAVFSGTRSQYTITRNVDGTVTVTGKDGIDEINKVRLLKFDDKVEALNNAAPTGLSLSGNTVLVENAPLGAGVGQLSATDADGDTLTYSLAPGSSSAFGVRTVNGVSSLVVTGSLDFETQPTHQVTIQARDDYGGVTSLTVNLTVTNNPAETTPFTIWGTAQADTLNGENGHDTVYGSSGNDGLNGALGNDRLHGGTGNDSLWGQGGKDVFVFDTRSNKSTNVDRVYDFRSADDSFYLDNKYFTKLGSGSLSKPKKFKSDMFVESNKARDAEDRIVYDRKTGALYYDQDGTGSKAQVKIATITTKTKLYYHDFFVI